MSVMVRSLVFSLQIHLFTYFDIVPTMIPYSEAGFGRDHTGPGDGGGNGNSSRPGETTDFVAVVHIICA